MLQHIKHPYSHDVLSEIRGLKNELRNKAIRDGGITVDFWIIKVHTSN